MKTRIGIFLSTCAMVAVLAASQGNAQAWYTDVGPNPIVTPDWWTDHGPNH
jgi:hypothetical protein